MRPLHVAFVMANNSRAPYLTAFMRRGAALGVDRFSFVAMTAEPPEMVEEARSFGFEGHWLPFDHNRRKRSMLAAVPRLTLLFRRLAPDVVHTHLFDDSLPGMLAARLAGVRRRVVTKGDTGFHHVHVPLWVAADRFTNANATDVVALSQEALDFVRDVERCPRGKLRMIHHGVDAEALGHPDADEVAALQRRLSLRGRFVVGTVSRFIAWKGHRALLEVAEIVRRRAPNVCFLWVGTGGERPGLERLVRERGLEDTIRFVGGVPPSQMPALYSAMDVYLHGARLEPFGLVIAEAMMAGLPVVSTPTGAARDALVHRENGWIGGYDSPESLAEGVLFFHQNPPGKPFRRAQATARALFSFDQMYDRYRELYAS